MRCLVVLLSCSCLVGFAPAPPVRPLDDPDQAISQFDGQIRATDEVPEVGLTSRKKQLLNRLEELQGRLLRRGRTDEAATVRDRAIFAASLSTSNRLGDTKPMSQIRQASGEGKYHHLLHVLPAPNDQATYSDYKDFGFWNGTVYGTQDNLKSGHWVYVYPRWFIWRDGPASPKN